MKTLKLAAGLACALLALSAVEVHAQGIQLPIIEVTPSSVDFGDVPIGAVAQQSIMIKNLSADSPLTVKQVKTKLPFGDTAPTPFTIQPGQSRRVNLAFAPQSTGAHSGYCTIVSNASNARVVNVPLSGTGT